jgi:hypothetical protein
MRIIFAAFVKNAPMKLSEAATGEAVREQATITSVTAQNYYKHI